MATDWTDGRSAGKMRAQIAITRGGVTKASTSASPPEGGALAKRANGTFQISLHRRITESALINLMRALRAIEPELPMNLRVDAQLQQGLSRSELCLQLALRALGDIERNNEALFMSNLELVQPATLKSLTSSNLLRLAQLDMNNMDAPSALMKASAARVSNLVSVGQNRSMRLYFLALPAEVDWPASLPDIGVPLDEETDSVPCRWLSTLYEAAMAIQAPLYHHGFIRIGPAGMRPFKRIIQPITPQNDRPSNFRVLSVAEISENDAIVII